VEIEVDCLNRQMRYEEKRNVKKYFYKCVEKCK